MISGVNGNRLITANEAESLKPSMPSFLQLCQYYKIQQKLPGVRMDHERSKGTRFKCLLKNKDTCSCLEKMVKGEIMEQVSPVFKGCLAYAHRGFLSCVTSTSRTHTASRSWGPWVASKLPECLMAHTWSSNLEVSALGVAKHLPEFRIMEMITPTL